MKVKVEVYLEWGTSHLICHRCYWQMVPQFPQLSSVSCFPQFPLFSSVSLVFLLILDCCSSLVLLDPVELRDPCFHCFSLHCQCFQFQLISCTVLLLLFNGTNGRIWFVRKIPHKGKVVVWCLGNGHLTSMASFQSAFTLFWIRSMSHAWEISRFGMLLVPYWKNLI